MDVVLPKPGRYVVAVSGGVDSVALLDILAKRPGLELIVAHFDHGIRPDSADDRRFVEEVSKKYGLSFIYAEGNLDAEASEATARQARYEFLEKVKVEQAAEAIVTAHHEDDVLETAILNLLRGTGRKGLSSLQSQPGLIRPLLKVSKAELLEYAENSNLEWREDPTNQDTDYLRNHVRHEIVSKFSASDKEHLLVLIKKSTLRNQELDLILSKLIEGQSLERQWFSQLPHDVAREVMASWLRSNSIRDFDKKTIERLVVAAKTGQPSKSFPIIKNATLKVTAGTLEFVPPVGQK